MSLESPSNLGFDSTGRPIEINFNSEKPKHWWEDLKELSQVIADVSSEAFHNIKNRIPKIAELVKNKIKQRSRQEITPEQQNISETKEDKKEIKRVYDVSHGKGSLRSRNELKGRAEADPNFGQRKKVTEYTDESNKIKDTSFYQRGEQTGDEQKIRETIYRSQEDKEKTGTILIREKNRVIKKNEEGSERIITREDGKLYSEIIRIDENGNKVSEGKKLIYPKEKEVTLSERVETYEEKEKKNIELRVEEIGKAAVELYAPLWKKNSENKVKELLNSQEFKDKEALLLIRIAELIPQVINIEELKRAGLKPEEIRGICNSYAEGMLFGLMMRSAPLSDEKMGPFVNLLSSKLGQYKDLVIESGVLKRDISAKDKKSTSTKKQEAVESTTDIAERLVRFHEIMSMFPGAQQLLNRYANLVDIGLPVEPILQASIEKNQEQENSTEYFTNRISEILSQTFPLIELNSATTNKIVTTLLKEFRNKLRYDFLSKNGLDTPLPLELLTSENAISMFDEFISKIDLNTALEFELGVAELQGLRSLRKTYNQARELFTNKFGLENIEFRDSFIRDALERFRVSKNITYESWPIVFGTESTARDFIKFFESLELKNLEENKLITHETNPIIISPETNKLNTEETKKTIKSEIKILRAELPRLIKDRLGLLVGDIYNERQVENLVNFLISQLPQKEMKEYINGGEVKIENLLLMADIQLEELISTDRLYEILSPPTIYDKVVRFAESRKKEIVRTGAIFALLTILTQTPIVGAAKRSYEEGLGKTTEITQEVNGIISSLEPLLAGIDFSKPDVEQIVAVFENSPMGLDKNLLPQLELKIQNVIETSEGKTEGLSEKLITAYAEVSLNGLNFGANESATFAGMYDGLEVIQKTSDTLTPTQTEPVVEEPTFYGSKIISSENVSRNFIFIETSGDYAGSQTTFEYQDSKFTIINLESIKNSEGISKENIFRLGLNISRHISPDSSIFIVGNNTSGYKIITTQPERNNENIEITPSAVVDNATLILEATPEALEGQDPTSETIRIGYALIKPYLIGEKNYNEIIYNPEIRKIDINSQIFQQVPEEGQMSYRQVIENSIGSTDGQLNYVYQSGLDTCSISARTTVVGDLLGQEIDTYDLGHYINSFYGETDYERTMEARDILRLIPEDLRGGYLEILKQLADANLEVTKASETLKQAQVTENQIFIQNAEKIKNQAEYRLDLIEKEIDEWVNNNISEDSIIKIQGDIRSQFIPNQVNALDALGINVTPSSIINDWREKYSSENIGQGQVEAIPESIIQDAEELSLSFLNYLQENTDENSRVIIDTHLSVWGKEDSRHSISVIGVNVEEGYFLIKDTNGYGFGSTYNGNTDVGLIPTISPIGEEGIYKISLKVDSSDIESSKKVARTLISFYNTFVISKY